MTLRKQGTAAARKDPGPGLDIEHLGGPTRVATTLGKVRSPTMLNQDGTAAGVLTVSGDASFTNENLIARETMLSQSASQHERRDPLKEDPLRRYGDAISRQGSGAENGGSTIDAEIATLERLNRQDSQLCDELRASCTIGNSNRNTKTSGGQQVARSCWSLVQGALPKGPFSGTTSPRSAEKGAKAGGKGDGDREGGESSGAKKRVFSKYDEETTSILTEWFLSHKRWPYPAAKEKDALAEATNLTTLQISNWFTNKRKRHWTPVIKKRTRSPRDFFEFCVMNPKEHSLVEKRDGKESKEHLKTSGQPPQLTDDNGGVRNSAYATSSATGVGMGNPQGSVGGMSSVSGSGQAADQRGYPASVHNGAQAVSFDGRAADSSVETSTTNGIPVGSGWVHGAGGADPRSGGGGSIALLDHPRPSPSQQQQQQQQGGPQHPGTLAPGLVYASTAARQAANIDPPLSHHQMAPWMTPPSGVDRRSQHSSYSEMGRRASQPGPLPTSPAPLHLEDPRDDPRLRGYHSQYDIRGFDPNAPVPYQHVQQGQDAYRRGDDASGSSLQSQQLQSYTQQQLLQQQQSQLQSQRPANPGSSLGQQTSLPMPGTPASHGAATSNSSLWSSYRAPSPRNLVGTPTYGHHGATSDAQQRGLEPPVSYYSKGMGGTDVSHYPSTPATHTTAGDYGWRDSGSRSEAFPPIAAFVSPNVSEGNGFDMSSVGSGAIPPPASLDGRSVQQQLQQQQQQLLQTPTDPTNAYYDRSFVSRGWAPGNVGGASLPPPPGRGPNTADYQRPGVSEGSLGAVATAQPSDVSRSGITSSAGWR